MSTSYRYCADCMESVGLPRERSRLAHPGFAPKRLVSCDGESHKNILILVNEHGAKVKSTPPPESDPFEIKSLQAKSFRDGRSLTL